MRLDEARKLLAAGADPGEQRKTGKVERIKTALFRG